MVITSGRVVAGKIVVDGDPLPEGAAVTILTREGDESFVLDARTAPRLRTRFESNSSRLFN